MAIHGRIVAVIARTIGCASGLVSKLAPVGISALALVLTGCFWGDRGYPPTTPPGYIPSPPRYVRITKWLRPNYFAAEYYRGAEKKYDNRFVVITREKENINLGQGWYARDWRTNAVPAELTEQEELDRARMELLWPPGTVVELDYPLAHEHRDKIGQSEDVLIERTYVREYQGYLIVLVRVMPDETLRPSSNE